MNNASGDDQWARFASSLRVELVQRARFLEVDVQISRKGLGVTVELAKQGSSTVLFAFCDGASIDVWLPGSWEWRWQDAVENFPELDGAVPEGLSLSAIMHRGLPLDWADQRAMFAA